MKLRYQICEKNGNWDETTYAAFAEEDEAKHFFRSHNPAKWVIFDNATGKVFNGNTNKWEE